MSMAILNTNYKWLIILPVVTVGPLKKTEKIMASVVGVNGCLRHCDEVQGIYSVISIMLLSLFWVIVPLM